MSIDPSRYALLTNEYRWDSVYDATVDNAYAKAKELSIASLFSQSSAQMAAGLFAVIGTPKRRFQVDLTGIKIFTTDSFVKRTPNARLIIPKLNIDGKYIVTRCAISRSENLTKVELWGM